MKPFFLLVGLTLGNIIDLDDYKIGAMNLYEKYRFVFADGNAREGEQLRDA
jgi:hypothetical protein